MKSPRNVFATAGAALAMVIVAAPAFAGSNEDATAEALFMEGKQLMAEGNYARACVRISRIAIT